MHVPGYWREDHLVIHEGASLVDRPSTLAEGSPLVSLLVILELATGKGIGKIKKKKIGPRNLLLQTKIVFNNYRP
jgi:hypothetical protein